MTQALKAQTYEHRINDLERVQYTLLKKVDNLEVGMNQLSNALDVVREEEQVHFSQLRDSIDDTKTQMHKWRREMRSGWLDNLQTKLIIFLLVATLIWLLYTMHFS